ncbi:FAD-dependent monooxygenase [Streptomyces albus]
MKTVLISGASVAGLALAQRLHAHGYAPTVVERAPAVRPGGHAIDVRGAALTVLDRMGLLAEARRARTRTRGMSMLDGDGNELWRSTEMTYSAGRLDSDDIELLREDLTALLHRNADAHTTFLFGDAVAALDQTPDGVHVTFASGARRTYDYVVGADGLHSGVRRLVFGPDAHHLRHLGSYVAVFTPLTTSSASGTGRSGARVRAPPTACIRHATTRSCASRSASARSRSTTTTATPQRTKPFSPRAWSPWGPTRPSCSTPCGPPPTSTSTPWPRCTWTGVPGARRPRRRRGILRLAAVRPGHQPRPRGGLRPGRGTGPLRRPGHRPAPLRGAHAALRGVQPGPRHREPRRGPLRGVSGAGQERPRAGRNVSVPIGDGSHTTPHRMSGMPGSGVGVGRLPVSGISDYAGS